MAGHQNTATPCVQFENESDNCQTEFEPVEVVDHLTVFLGGAGMNGSYNEAFMASFKKAGIMNPVYGNYSGWLKDLDNSVPAMLDMGVDASSVIFYNQAPDDPDVATYGECDHSNRELVSETEHWWGTVRRYDEPCEQGGFSVGIFRGKDSDEEFPLSAMSIAEPLPLNGQFNFVGYSWGAIIAARSALYHAEEGITVDNLVLIGAPINQSLLDAVSQHDKIRKVTVIDLTAQNDPIYAGMTDTTIINSVPLLIQQMGASNGHFYYAPTGPEYDARRDTLANRIYGSGVR
ncbi:MAG: hypothetical protein ACRBCI_03555 [Cellvibrionaceae bacterium]